MEVLAVLGVIILLVLGYLVTFWFVEFVESEYDYEILGVGNLILCFVGLVLMLLTALSGVVEASPDNVLVLFLLFIGVGGGLLVRNIYSVYSESESILVGFVVGLLSFVLQVLITVSIVLVVISVYRRFTQR